MTTIFPPLSAWIKWIKTVMDKMDYISKIEEKLKDQSVYEQITKDPTKHIFDKIKVEADKLLALNKISLAQHYELIGIEDLPSVRGQPKLHKKDNPMRLITCSRNTITSPVSKFVFKVIKDLRSTVSGVVINTTKFVDEISKITLDKDERLASLDIKELFDNIPVTRAVDLVIQRLSESKKLDGLPLTKTDVKRLILVSLNNSYFSFNGKYYRQSKGLPMGNALSPLIADIFMDDYLKTHLKEGNIEKEIYRYVDDILIVTKMDEQCLNDYVEKCNKIPGRIRFTFEFEQNDQISFHDTTLKRKAEPNKVIIKVRWFRKSTAADRFLNFESAHGNSIKKNIVKNMVSRILQTSKEPSELREDLNKLKEMLLNSHYPSKEIDHLIKEACESSNITQKSSTPAKDMKFTMVLPYVKGIEVLKRKLEKLGIKLYFSYPNK
ncbi:unnamed protein product [Didymodactylos carnosus]|uniref:Reverse transcriptase domain-containing protein n=1 Tax=Didymodactylos carnosus TaxID=1234261 RepID=A0A813WJ36_9BILA|nr:unnamed protein product [Didymodactylos carnosus]CAF3639068.1 unnamed protein product [Didymodactylos carnosus]